MPASAVVRVHPDPLDLRGVPGDDGQLGLEDDPAVDESGVRPPGVDQVADPLPVGVARPGRPPARRRPPRCTSRPRPGTAGRARPGGPGGRPDRPGSPGGASGRQQRLVRPHLAGRTPDVGEPVPEVEHRRRPARRSTSTAAGSSRPARRRRRSRRGWRSPGSRWRPASRRIRADGEGRSRRPGRRPATTPGRAWPPAPRPGQRRMALGRGLARRRRARRLRAAALPASAPSQPARFGRFWNPRRSPIFGRGRGGLPISSRCRHRRS